MFDQAMADDGGDVFLLTVYNHQTYHRASPSILLAHHLILGQKVKGQCHSVTKCKNLLKAIEWPA